MAESPQLALLVEDLDQALGKGRVKLVIHDRGFIDGATVKRLKERGIDTLFPLKEKGSTGRMLNDSPRSTDAPGRRGDRRPGIPRPFRSNVPNTSLGERRSGRKLWPRKKPCNLLR
jgi:hypothetical protein